MPQESLHSFLYPTDSVFLASCSLPMEQRIRFLCKQLLEETDPTKMRDISAELQMVIHSHVEDIRQRLLEIPANRFVPFTLENPAA